MLGRALAAAVTIAALSAAGAAADGGPAPAPMTGWTGIAAPGGVRYVAVTSSRDTVVEQIETRSGRVMRYGWVRGIYGIPTVAFDGTTSGLSRDGKHLVLSTYP